MSDRRVGILVWLATTVIVTVAGHAAYRALTDPGDLPGRTDLQAVLDDPARLFDDPGALGSAVEQRAFDAVTRCMAAAGFDYRGPVSIASSLDELVDPARAGYSIAAGEPVPPLQFGDRAPVGTNRDEYEAALYGTTLDGGADGGGCAAAGRSELTAAYSTLASLPYSLARLEAEAGAHPDYQVALGAWRSCMADAGWSYESPDAILADLRSRLSAVRGDAARELASEERRIAVDDQACRTGTIDPAVAAIAGDLGPAFVEANRPQLESLLPVGDEDPALPPDLGGGDVQVSLRWPARSDLDLQVADPTGAVVSYNNRTVASGGALDRDANAGCSINSLDDDFIENIFWADDEAPPGTYIVTVRVYSSCSAEVPMTYELIVQVRGEVVQWVRSTISSGSYSLEFEVRE